MKPLICLFMSSMKLLWRPIAELNDQTRYRSDLLLCAPELVDLDCNVRGVGPGYWQDDRDVPTGPDGAIRKEGVDYGGFLAAKWSMTSDEWREVPVTPTHFLIIEGPMTNAQMEEMLRAGEALDVSGCPRDEHGDYLLPPGFFRESVDYCDAVQELWVHSIGRHIQTGEVLASTSGRFYQNPLFECLWLR
jgi:hypothetical protein